MQFGGVEITIWHVVIGFSMFAVYLILTIICKQLKLRRERKIPNILRQFEKIPGLHTQRTPSYTFFCGESSQTHSSIYSQDRDKVQRLLRNLFQNYNIRVPDTTVAVCIPTWCSSSGDRFHQFHCRPPIAYCPCPTIVSEYHYTYKMVSGRVQATYFHDRRCTCLAGICIYMRIPDEPWFFSELPESLIMDLIGPGVKRWITPRGSRRRVTVLPTAPPLLSPSAPPLSVESQRRMMIHMMEEEEEEVGITVDASPPPAYSTIRGTRIFEDETLPPSYFTLFSSSSKL